MRTARSPATPSRRSPTARIVLEVVAKLDSERDAMTAKIADAEAVAAEWEDADDSGLTDAVDLLRALGQADTAEALNAAMSAAVAGIYAGLRDGRLRAEFELADGRPSKERFGYLLRYAEPANLDAIRVTFGETVRQTFVQRCLGAITSAGREDDGGRLCFRVLSALGAACRAAYARRGLPA